MRQFDVHFCMVSAQALANFLPVLDKVSRPKEVVFLVSDSMRKQFEALAVFLRRYQVRVHRVDVVDAFDIAGVRDAVMVALEQFADRSVVLNVTGGTKPMAIGAQEAFYVCERPFFYLNHETNQVQLIEPRVDQPVERSELQTRLTLVECLGVHGFGCDAGASVKLTSEQADLVQFLVGYARSNAECIRALNRFAYGVRDRRALSGRWVDSVKDVTQGALFKEVLERFDRAGYLTYTKDEVHFASEDALRFANGLWFELYVAQCVDALPDVSDALSNVTVSSGSVKNELDCAFVAKNRLHIIECKTQKMDGDSDLEIRDAIYKLETLKRLGGLNSKCMLVSYLPVKNDHFKRRAADSGIKLVDGTQLGNLKSILIEWVGTKR